MDWTYSPFVAAKFAAEGGTKGAVISCLTGDWCRERAEAQPLVGSIVKQRAADEMLTTIHSVRYTLTSTNDSSASKIRFDSTSDSSCSAGYFIGVY